MKLKTALFAIAAVLPLALPAAAHFPPTPNTNCNDGTDGNGDPIPHDFVGATSATVTTGITGEFGGGITIVFDGSLLPCGTEPLCPPGTPFIIIDPSGDDLPDGTDPSGDNIVIWCDDILVGGTQVPIGDGEYEFGLGGAFLPNTHHNPLANGYEVTTAATDGGFIFGSDADNDGDVEEGSGDCFESHSTVGTYATLCASGGDGGWWFFTKCNGTTLSGWTFTTNGPLLRLGLGDDDGDDIPNSLEDDDSDGIPNGLDDSNTADDFVNLAWNPTLTPGSIPPDVTASCLVAGHINAQGVPPPVTPLGSILISVVNGAGVVTSIPTGWACTHPVGGTVANGGFVECFPAIGACASVQAIVATVTGGALGGTSACVGGPSATASVTGSGTAVSPLATGAASPLKLRCTVTWSAPPPGVSGTVTCKVN